jgi:hypothetical protein
VKHMMGEFVWVSFPDGVEIVPHFCSLLYCDDIVCV